MLSDKKIPTYILAGGFGTRLKSQLKGKPKSLADINGTPFLEILLKKLIKQGFSNFILCLHYQSELIIDFLEKKIKPQFKNISINYIVESEPLGTGGAIKNALLSYPHNGDIIVMNSDTFIEKNFIGITDLKKNAILVSVVKDAYRYGKIIIDSNKIVLDFEEKDNLHESGLINLGVYKLNSHLFMEYKAENFSIENNLFPQLIKKEKVEVLEIDGTFIDIGIPEDYNLFCKYNLNGKIEV
jgi:D-glycero-alpha-D-manno-heptose 1-phosphate guanylyltransferase